MKVIRSIKKMREFSLRHKKRGKTVGFVPTMGALHQGHLSLVRAAKKSCDITVMSIFVNPTQFGPGEDYKCYPRNFKEDLAAAAKEGVDAVFAPSVKEMYPDGFSTFTEVRGNMTDILCGRMRPGHFKGVVTIVIKLFNIVMPDVSFFGQKDAQQAVVIGKMTRELDFPVEIRVMPIVREADGLAMSSRNAYLSRKERTTALSIYRALREARSMVRNGAKDSAKIKKTVEKILRDGGINKIDYVGIVDARSFKPVKKVTARTLVAVAVYLGKTRLIDNTIVSPRVRGKNR